MKNSLVSILIATVFALSITGCGGGAPKTSAQSSHVRLSHGKVIGYAYMENGSKLIKVSTFPSSPTQSDVETILITLDGFYPAYSVGTQECGRFFVRGVLNDFSNSAFCKSHYTSSDLGDAVGSAMWNTLLVPIGAIANPTVTANGKAIYQDKQTFNTEQFLQVVQDNHLDTVQQKLFQLYRLAQNQKDDIEKMYTPYFEKYKNNTSNIEFQYSVIDKSGLLVMDKLDANYLVKLNAPEKKSFDYVAMIKIDATPESFANDAANTLNEMEHVFAQDKADYKKYLDNGFANYRAEGPSSRSFTHNEYISYNATIKAPHEIKYLPNEKIKIPVAITVETASLHKMVPKSFVLADKNIHIEFEVNKDLTVSVIASNSTQSFITGKSLTSYYKNGVYNIPNIDREIAPESTTLSSNSNYELLSNDMAQTCQFDNMTKAKAKGISLNYGYALKYRINDTNIDKSIYKKEKYMLYDIFKQYI